MANSPVIYCIEIGGTNMRGGFFEGDTTSEVVLTTTPRRGRNPQQNREVLLSEVQALVEDVARVAPPMRGLAVSVTGMLQLESHPGARTYGPFTNHELRLTSPNIDGMNDVSFLSWLEQVDWGVPIHVENDANAALRSETAFPTAISINMGTGIAAAVKENGLIKHIEDTWSCLEIGHTERWPLPDYLVRRCHCGDMGCLEAAIGARSLADRYGVRPEAASPETYKRMRSEVVEYLAPAIADTTKQFDINQVLLSGRAAWGFSNEFDFRGALTEKVVDLRPDAAAPVINLIQFREIAGLRGVALAMLDYHDLKPGLRKHDA